MTSQERREKGLLFIADDNDWVEMKRARKITQQLNTIDRCDFKGINTLVRELKKYFFKKNEIDEEIWKHM